MANMAENETRTFARPRPGFGALHIERKEPPETIGGYLRYSRPGSRWTYCGRSFEHWAEIIEPKETPMDDICRTCQAAYFNDEDAE